MVTSANKRTWPEVFSLYQFDSKEAKTLFYRVCGIQPFSNPRAAPDMYCLNIRCLDNFDLASKTYKVTPFGERNWGAAVTALNMQWEAASGLTEVSSGELSLPHFSLLTGTPPMFRNLAFFHLKPEPSKARFTCSPGK